MTLDAMYLDRGVGQVSIVMIRSNRVSDQQELWPGGLRLGRYSQQPERTGTRYGCILDQIMQLGPGNQQGFEIKVVQRAVRNDNGMRTLRDFPASRRNQNLIQVKSILVRCLQHVPGPLQLLAIVADQSINNSYRGKWKQSDMVLRHCPQVGISWP